MLVKVLARNANEVLVRTPEGRIILSVIGRAIADADSGRCREAERFFCDGRLDGFAQVIGLDPQCVRETIGKVRDYVNRKA